MVLHSLKCAEQDGLRVNRVRRRCLAAAEGKARVEMSDKGRICTYIGANTVRGQGAHRSTLYDPEKTERVILIKGGAGNGKSTLMEKICRAAEKNHTVERVYCPSDPKSLDGMVCEELGFAMVDATPPHVWEAENHCLPEEYLSLSPYVSRAVLGRKRAVTELSVSLKDQRAQAEKCIKAAFEADSELCGEVLTYADTGDLCSLGRELAKKYLGAAGEENCVYAPMKRRFISAVSPGGTVNFSGTPYAICGEGTKTVAIRDRFGLSPFLLGAVVDEVQNRGLKVWGFFDPLVSSRLTGLAIPSAKLCFLPEDSAKEPLETADTAEALPRGSREALCPRLEVLSSVKNALLDEAELRLGKCLELHDRIEAEYRPYMDFEGLNALGESLIAGLVGPG